MPLLSRTDVIKLKIETIRAAWPSGSTRIKEP